ncbi:MAG: hypothetical protein LBQ61_00530 [Spirochaetales bacterium]|nr:hypothetical protein [Spirochaetales bacterium]
MTLPTLLKILPGLFFVLGQVPFALSAREAEAAEWEGGSPELYFKIVSAREAEEPLIAGDKVLFFYKPSEPTRFVGAAFAHEDFVQIHPFKINENNLFYLVYPIPENRDSLRYRLVIDGVWVNDPANSLTSRSQGINFSVLPLPPQTRPAPLSGPQFLPGGRVRFLFRASPGERVCLAGSFNRWDPYLYPMGETEPGSGLYEITLSLLPGVHSYGFVYRGQIYTDAFNLNSALDPYGREVSVLSLP